MLYAIAGAWLLGMILGSSLGYKFTSDAFEAEAFHEVTKVNDMKKEMNDAIFVLADNLAKEQRNTKVEFQKIITRVTQYVEKPVYRNVCIDDDGLRAINAAISKRPLDPEQPTATVREGNTFGGERWQGANVQDTRVGEKTE